MSKGKIAIDAAKKLLSKLQAIAKDPDNLQGTAAQRKAEQAKQDKAVETAKEKLAKAKADDKQASVVGKKPTTKTPTAGKQPKPDEAPKVTMDKEAKKTLTRQRVKAPADKQAARDSDSPMIRNLQNQADIRTGGNRKKDLDPTQTKAEAGASAKRIGSDFTRQEQIGMQKSLDRQMGELEWYKKNQPNNNEQIAILRKEIAKLKKRGFLKVKDSYAPKKPAIEGATASGAKPKPKAKPFTGSKRAAFNAAKDKGAKTFTFEGQTFNTSAVAKQFADAEKSAGLNRGGAVKRAIGSADFRRGGMVLSTVDNRRNK